MSEKKLRLGLIGKDVSQSRSEEIHRFILGEWGYVCEYEKFSVGKEDLDGVMRCLLGDFDGFNVTIPYKRDVMAYLDDMQGDALLYGAVNTVVCSQSKGYNTDGDGFDLMLRLAGVSVSGKKVLVLGGGGAARSVAVRMKLSGGQVFVYRRNKEELKELCQEISVFEAKDCNEGGYDILVNCTGVGMHDSVGLSPVERRAFAGAEYAVDLIYNPEESEFLRLAKEMGVSALNGNAMLFYQAYFADCYYTDRAPNDEEAQRLYHKFLARE